MDARTLEHMIASGIPDSQVEVVDLHGTGDHFDVTVVAPQFEGMSLVERHRSIYAAVGDAMSGAIHALMIKALTPAQFRNGLVGTIPRS